MSPKRKTIFVGDDYLDLVKRFPLRVIRSERELDAAAAVAMKLAIKGEEQLSDGETEYLDVLDRLNEDYEEQHHVMPVGKASALERLRALVKEAGMGASDLGRLLGNRSLGSLLLSGRREVSKAHIRVLADHFRVEAGYFL
ncbi:MAG TPA: transcriptional regulator [Phycisphaerae bacterium]|nr:transcriptional regulator [Phycisphaerae bacterium]